MYENHFRLVETSRQAKKIFEKAIKNRKEGLAFLFQ